MNATNGTSGSGSAASKAYPPGIHVPTPTFFKEDVKQSIDWETQEKHTQFLVKSGVQGSKIICFQIPSQTQRVTLVQSSLLAQPAKPSP